VPRKIRQLEGDLAKAGFTRSPGKGSHRHWTHPKVKIPVTISGQPGDDAQRYQEQEVKEAIKESRQP
jgi:predicted RNA binding protein YcfA (HicA-like mRNA interferase family)